MTDYKPGIIAPITAWMWEQLKTHGIMSDLDYGAGASAMVPIIPVSQEIEFMDAYGSAPFIVYDYFPVEHDSDMWMVSCSQVLFTIYASSYGKITEIRNLLEDMFRRQDVAAAELNATLTQPSKFNFYTLGIISGSETEPRTELGGRLASEMIMEVHYIRQLTSSGRYA